MDIGIGLLKISALLIGVGASFTIAGVINGRLSRRIRDTHRQKLNTAAQGLVEVQGFVLPYKKESKSVDGRSAVYRELEIQRLVGIGGIDIWATLHREREGGRFLICDGTGLAVVHTEGAEFLMEKTCFDWNSLPSQLRVSMLGQYGSQVRGLLKAHRPFGRSYRLVEKAIYSGSPVYVIGHFQTSAKRSVHVLHPEEIHFLEKIVEFSRDPDKQIRFFDIDGDGSIDEGELRSGAYELLLQTSTSAEPAEVGKRVALQGVISHTSAHPLFISDTHEQQLLKRISRGSSAMKMTLGGLLLIGLGVLSYGLAEFVVGS